MTKTINKIDDFTYQVAVELDHEELRGFIHDAEDQIAQASSLNGFRPGKAPKEVVRNQVGEQKIREEALQLAVQKSMSMIVKQENLDVIDQSEFVIKTNTDLAFVYSVKLSVIPPIKLGEYRGLKIQKKPVSVSDAEVEKVIADLIKSRTKFSDENREAKAGDRVEVDFKITEQDKVIENGISENHPLILGDQTFIPGFEDNIIGMNIGEERSFKLAVPADYYQKTIAGKTLSVEVKLKKVQLRTVPELNDEFVKTLGGFATVADVRSSIAEGLRKEKEFQEQERVRLSMLKQISIASMIRIPPQLIERQLDSMLENFDRELHGQGMELGLYLAHIKKTQDELRASWNDQAKQQIQYDLIIDEIARKEALSVSVQELQDAFQNRLEQFMQSRPNDGQKAVDSLNIEAIKNKLNALLVREKVYEFLENGSILSND